MKKYNFIAVIECRNCNPNGDPLNDNKPRTDADGHAEMTPVCIDHKLRVEAEYQGEKVYMSASGQDGFACLNDRTLNVYPEYHKDKKKNLVEANKELSRRLNEEFWDCRMFGFVIPFANNYQRKAVSIQSAHSVDPVDMRDIQITKCIGLEAPKAVEKKNANGEGEGEFSLTRSSDTMGMLHTIDFGLIVVRGYVCPELAKAYGVTDKDIDRLKECLVNMFEHDGCLARPAGSMMVRNVFWFEQEGRIANEAKIYDAFHVEHKDGIDKPRRYQDYRIWVDEIPNVACTDLVNS